MALPLSQEKREAIVFHKINGEKENDIARWLRISKSSVTKTWKLYKTHNSVSPKLRTQGRKPAFGQETLEKIIAKIKEQPDITLLELIDKFELKISESGLSKKLNKIDLNFKKRRFLQKSNNAKMSKNAVKNGLNISRT
jgi:transposase